MPMRWARNCLRDFLISRSSNPLRYKQARVMAYNSSVALRRLRYHASAAPLLNIGGYTFRGLDYCKELYIRNFIYGIASSLENYSSYSGPIWAAIEHGVYFGDYVVDSETVDSGFNGVITFSEVRKDRIKNRYSNCNVIPIGPYIQYAEQFLDSSEIANLKDRLGKTLIVFPSHSIEGVNSTYQINEFVDAIEHIKETLSINSVIINLYYVDCKKKIIDEYEKYGYITSSAGHCYDPLFLSRLKTLITLADYSISNSVGTHVGYCVSLGVPHTVISQTIERSYRTPSDKISINEHAFQSSDLKEVEESFSQLSSISEEQLRVVRKYWGFGIHYSEKELRSLLQSLEPIG